MRIEFAVPVSNGEQEKYSEQWIAARDAYRRLLFGDRADPLNDTNTHPSSAKSLAELALKTDLKRSRGTEKFARQKTANSVDAILTYHDNQRRGEGAIFSIVDPKKDMRRVSALTARVLWTWERALMRNSKSEDVQALSPFANLPGEHIKEADFEEFNVRLVIEAAAAVLETLQLGYPSGSIDSSQHQLLASLIAQRGPDFAGAWIRGDYIVTFVHNMVLMRIDGLV